MKKVFRFCTPLIAVAMMSIAPAFVRAQDSQNATKSNQTQNAPAAAEWNTPPAGTEQAQQGYRDGIEALQLDRAAKRTIDARVSHLYVHPPVRGTAREEYRASFAAGYEAAMKHAGA